MTPARTLSQRQSISAARSRCSGWRGVAESQEPASAAVALRDKVRGHRFYWTEEQPVAWLIMPALLIDWIINYHETEQRGGCCALGCWLETALQTKSSGHYVIATAQRRPGIVRQPRELHASPGQDADCDRFHLEDVCVCIVRCHGVQWQ